MRNPSTCGSSGATTTKTPCCSKLGLKRGPWTPEEDELLANYIKKEGEGRWRTLPKRAGLLRCGKSCRLRWMNYLRPCVKRGQIAPDEEDLILRLHRLLGNRWSLIAGRIPGRTDNEIKNYWNTHLSKKLISQGIDPRTHKPLNLDQSIDHQNKVSSSLSKPNHKSSPSSSPKRKNNNNISSSPAVEETTGGFSSHQVISNTENVYFETTSLNQYHTTNASLWSCSGNHHGIGGMDLRSNNIQRLRNEGDEEINYCSDDIFSSFINSLMNEDAFIAQQQLQHQHQAINGVLPLSDPLVSINASSFGLVSGWESALMSSTFNQNDPSKRVTDHLD